MRRTALWLVAAAVVALLPPALGYAGFNKVWLTPYSDGFWNYDFDQQNSSTAYIDFPIGTLWSCQGNETAIKDYLRTRAGPGYPGPSGPALKWEYVYDGSTIWNGDSGRQTACYCQGGDGYMRHTRIYAPYDNRFYNSTWQYYVIASQHYDINHAGCDRTDCGYSQPGNERFGYSESVENIIASEARADSYTVNDPDYNMQNYGYFWEGDGKHYQQSDGYAARVCFY